MTTLIDWNVEDQDTNGFFPGSGTTITIPSGTPETLFAATLRLMVVSLTVAGRCFGSINVTSAVSGTPSTFRLPFDVNEDQVVVPIPVIALIGSDTLTCDVFHSQGASRDVNCWFSLYRIGA